MGTSNKEVFDKFLLLIKDRTLCQLLTDQELSEVLNQFLSGSASLYFKNCRKDLSQNKASYLREFFDADGIETEFTISNYPESPNSSSIQLVAELDGVAVDYTFDDITKTFTISPAVTGDLVLGYDFVGDFVETLDDEEQWILAHGMVVIWTSSQIRDYDKLREKMTNKDFNNLYSPANLLSKLSEMRKMSLLEIRFLTISYSKESIVFDGFR